MQKFLRILIVLAAFVSAFGINTSKATHLMGADVQWKSLGNDTFEISIIVYRRCTDGAVTLTVNPPAITSDSCGNSYNVSAGSLIEHLVEEITPICQSQQKICPAFGGSGTSTPQIPFGVEKHTLKYKVYLGGNFANCCWYKLQWQQSARNSNITTGFADANFLTEAWLNRCKSPADNGPVFHNPPIMIRCAGQDVVYNHAVYDQDGDSLSYAMALPLGGGTYTSPWSYTYPLTCLGGNNPNPNATPPTGFNVNPASGEISFRPMQVQVTVLKIMVTEWRKDSINTYRVIGKTARDMQFGIIQNCNNDLPGLSGPASYNVCAGDQICITINTSDPDNTDTTRIYWNTGIPQATWTTNNGAVKNATGTFCWTPSGSQASNLPYYFTATVNDNHCPLIGITAKSYSIKVNPYPAKPVITKNINILSSTAAGSYQWYNDTTLIVGATSITYSPGSSGTYKVKVTKNGCSTFSDPFSYTVGINTNILQSKVKISPNPFHDQLSIEIIDFEKPVLISLYDMQGKLILKQNIKVTGIINTSTISSGIYLLEATDGVNKSTYKVEKH